MSPAVGVGANGERGFPRVSGDEPQVVSVALNVGEFSPREWG